MIRQKIPIGQLLTPQDVAEALQISIRTVYDNKDRLGVFYPAGIRVLRFPKRLIDGIVEGQNQEGLALQLQATAEGLRGRGIQHPSRSGYCPGGPPKDLGAFYTDSRRHGLEASSQPLSRPGRGVSTERTRK